MALQSPPPSISPRQMNLLRIVASMAWCDGNLASEEAEVMLDRFSGIFAKSPSQQQHLRQELQDYVIQNIPLRELTPKLQTQDEKELVLRLGYEVIRSSARTPDEDSINADEAATYQELVTLLGLPADVQARIEAEVEQGNSEGSIVDTLSQGLESFAENH